MFIVPPRLYQMKENILFKKEEGMLSRWKHQLSPLWLGLIEKLHSPDIVVL